jgi:putative magnesium chelatase accessory protein
MTRTARLAYREAARSADPDRLIWERDGRDWPNRSASRFIRAGGLTWHVQQMGRGPVLLLVHGTGASTHSWRALAPLLARRFTVIAIDLPGHGFTEFPAAERLSLPGMAEDLGMLLKALGVSPDIAVGHSAGAAILARMCLDGRIAPAALISLNGAFLPLRGLPVHLLSPVTKVLVSIPTVPRLLARFAVNESSVNRLLRDTGSKLEPAGIAQYQRLFSSPAHIAGALGMMARWDLDAFARQLRQLKLQLVLVAGGNDTAIPPGDATRIQAVVPGAKVLLIPGLGHLAHEEAPARIAELIEDIALAARRTSRS